MIILCDVDAVTLDLTTEWLRRYNEDYDDNLTAEDITDWNTARFVKPECGDKIYDYLLADDLYDNVQPIPGAKMAIETLRSWGHMVIFLTAGLHKGKLNALKRHGLLEPGRESDRDYITCDRKDLIKGDLLIDDRASTVENFPGRAVLFDQPWNRGSYSEPRAIGWGGVLTEVASMHERAPVPTLNPYLTSEAIEEIKANTAKAFGVPGVMFKENHVSSNLIAGVGKDAPTVVNELGGKQSALNYRFDLMDPLPMFRLAHILGEGGEKYGLWNWRNITINDNLNHALSHIFAYLAGDTQDDHLGHAFCRLHFALSLDITPDYCKRMDPES